MTYNAFGGTLNLAQSITFEMQCYQRSLKISYREHVTNVTVLESVGQKRKLFTTVKCRKLKYFDDILHCTSLEKEPCWKRCSDLEDKAGNEKEWTDNQIKWPGKSITDLVQLAEDTAAYHKDSFKESPTLN